MNKLLRLILLLAAFAFTGWLGFLSTYDGVPKESSIIIEASPSDSEIFLDGKRVGAGEVNTFAGTHEISVAKNGFKPYKNNVETKVGDEYYEGVILESASKDTENWFNDNTDDQKLAESISSRLTDYEGEKYTAQNSLLKLLPVSYGDGNRGLVKISAGIPIGASTTPAIYISAISPEDRQSALGWIRGQGYDPANMDIVFYNELGAYAESDI